MIFVYPTPKMLIPVITGIITETAYDKLGG